MTDEINTNEVAGGAQAEAPAEPVEATPVESVQPSQDKSIEPVEQVEPAQPEAVEPVLNPAEVAESSTAQMEGNEPLTAENAQSEPESVSVRPLADLGEARTEPAPVLETPTPAPEPQTAQILRIEPFDSVPSKPSEAAPPIAPVVAQPSRNFIGELFAKGRIAIQSRKRKKLDRIMTLFEKRTNITNDEVEKLLHISDATATRYLNILEQEGKIKQVGKTGKFVSYTKI